MFGMEKKTVKPESSCVFELEKELLSEENRKELSNRIYDRVFKLKEILHNGSRKEEFEIWGILLNGYHALAIVLSRATQEPKKKI